MEKSSNYEIYHKRLMHICNVDLRKAYPEAEKHECDFKKTTLLNFGNTKQDVIIAKDSKQTKVGVSNRHRLPWYDVQSDVPNVTIN
jgi:hypothetical protein